MTGNLRFIWAFLAILLPNTLFSQYQWNESTNIHGENNMSIELIGEGYSNSTALTNAFFFGFVNGRFVDEDEKDIMLNRSWNNNRIGQDATYGIRFSHKLSDSSFISQWHIGIAERFHIDGLLSQEALELALYGNKRFAGETVDLSNVNLRYQRWKEIQFGAQKSLNSNWTVGLQAAWLIGDQNLDFQTNSASLYTSRIGDELQLLGDFYLHQSDTNELGPHAINGMGASVGLWARRNFTFFETAQSGWIQLGVSDLGFIQWNNESVRYDGDTLYVYEGTLIDRILDFEEENVNGIDGDSLLEIFSPDAKNGSYTTYTPANIALTAFQQFEKFEVAASLRYRLEASYFPQVFAQSFYYLNKWKVGGSIGFGGYAPFELGIGAQYELKHWHFSAGTRNLEGLVAWKQFGGASAYAQIGYFF